MIDRWWANEKTSPTYTAREALDRATFEAVTGRYETMKVVPCWKYGFLRVWWFITRKK